MALWDREIIMSAQGTLHHVEINVSDLARSRYFYDWLLPQLGYGQYQAWPQGFSYRLKDTYLVFVQTEKDHRHRSYHRKATGLNHLAFHASQSLIESIENQLKERNLSVLYPDKHPYACGKDCYALFIEDPDRIKIELAAY